MREIELTVDGRLVIVPEGASVAVAVICAGAGRRSITGARRMPLCGMGACWECRVSIDGKPSCRGCMVTVAPRMRVVFDG